MRFGYGYASDGVTPLYGKVDDISCSTHKEQGVWESLVAIRYNRNEYYRLQSGASTRSESIGQIVHHLMVHFECVPKIATLRIERGREQNLAGYLAKTKRHASAGICR